MSLAGCATAAEQPDGGPGASDPDARVASDLPDAAPGNDAPAPLPDAAPGQPDAGSPDAAPPPPDAAPPPDACTPSVVNLLTNADFDQGPGGGWAESSSGGFNLIVDESQSPITAHSPAHHTWLGGYLEESGVSGVDVLSQDITLPADATGFQIAGFRLIGTEEGSGEFDSLRITLRTTGGALLETLKDPAVADCTLNDCTWSNEDAVGSFTAFTLTPSGSYAGQTVRVHIESDVDSLLNTNFFFDSLAARVSTCP